MTIMPGKALVFAPRSDMLSLEGTHGRDRLARRLNGLFERMEAEAPTFLSDAIKSPPPNPTAFKKRIEKTARLSAVVVFYLGPLIERNGRYFLVTANSTIYSAKSQIDVSSLLETLPESTCFVAEELLTSHHSLLVATKDRVLTLASREKPRATNSDETIVDILLEAINYLPTITVNCLVDIWRLKHELSSCRSEPSHLSAIQFDNKLDDASVLRLLDYNLLSLNPGSREDGINDLQFFRASLKTSDEANFLNTYFAACDPDVNVRCAAERLQKTPKIGNARILYPKRHRLPKNFLDQFCPVPTGLFTMGSDKQFDPYSLPEEQPQHNVYLDYFRIARVPVTVGDWISFKKDTTPGFSEDVGVPRNLPRTYVSWYDAMEYCMWLTFATREQGFLSQEEEITLPSEAEWEKAARGTDGRIYPWGNMFEAACANYRENGPPHPVEVGRSRSHCSSPYGVADMAGNVWEWTRSLWGRNGASPEYSYPYSPEDGRENLNAPGDVRRVVRGGSWYYFDYCLRCSTRNLMYPYVVHSGGGFRTIIRTVK